MKVSAIPTFGPDGRPRRAYSLESVLYFDSRKTVIVNRRNGIVLSAHWYGESRMPLKNRVKAGTHYSHREQVGDHQAWAHQRLPSIASRGRGTQPNFTKNWRSANRHRLWL